MDGTLLREIWLSLYGAASLLMGAVGFGALVGVAYWVARDAAARGSSQPWTWGVGVATLLLLLPYYLYRRRRLGPRDGPPTHRERIAATWATAVLSVFVLEGLFVPPDPFLQIRNFWLFLPVTVPLAYVLIYRDWRPSRPIRS